jgi:tetratricopeptide (TPR) repeat protein
MKWTHRLLLFFFTFLLVFAAGGNASAQKRKKAAEISVKPDVFTDKLSPNDRQRFQYFFLEATRQQEAGHLAAAYDLLCHCEKIDSTSATVQYMKAMYLSILRKDSLALNALERAAALSPHNNTFQEKLAQYYLASQKYDKATEVYERLARDNRDRTDILNILVRLYQNSKEYEKMLSAINRIEQVEGESEQITLSKMNVYEMMGDKKRAYKALKAMADEHAEDVNYQVMLGNWFMQNNKQKNAYKIFRKAVEDEPDNTYALSSLYDYYNTTGQKDLAKQMSDRILTEPSTPSDTRIQFLKQAIRENDLQKGDSTEIVDLIEKIQQVVPKDSTVAELKVIYLSTKKFPQQQIDSSLVDLLNITPDNAPARLQLIQNAWPKQDWAKIDSLSEPGMLYNPDELAFYYFTGLARFYQKDDKGALNAFQHGTAQINAQSNPDIVADFYAIMADIYYQQGEREKAFAAFDSCLTWKPDYTMALNNYAYYLSVTDGDLKKAEEMSAKTIKSEPKNATFLDTYAWVLFKQGRYTEARIYIDQALVNDTDTTLSADVLEHAGDIYLKLNERQKAIDFWQKAIDADSEKAADLKKKIETTRKKRK